MNQSDDACKPMREAIARQYRGALAMLGEAIGQCPEDLWLSDAYQNRCWHIAWHALFYTHLQLQTAEAAFVPFAKHRKDAQFLRARPGILDHPYSKADALEYLELCRAEVDKQVPALDLDAPSGFPWLPFKKFELQLYTIRHIQHHAGQLIDRLRTAADIGIDWNGGF